MRHWADAADQFGCASSTFDDEHRLTRGSKNLERWLGRPLPIGEGMEALLTKGSAIYWETAVMPILDGQGHAHDVALDLNAAHGRVSLLAFSFMDPKGIHVLWVPFQHRERFERSLAEAEQRRRRDVAELTRLQELDTMRTEFINSIAHEMATPMTPIKLQLGLLRRLLQDSDPKIQHALDGMHENVARLHHFHNDVVLAAELQASKVLAERADVRLDEVVERGVAAWSAQHPSGAPIEVDAVECQAMASEAGIRDCLARLLDNARRFSPPDSTIEVRVRADPPRLEIQDHGRGIAPQRIARLGRPLAKGHSDDESSLLGAGLGLYIVSRWMHNQHGELGIHSSGEGQGTTVTLTFEASG